MTAGVSWIRELLCDAPIYGLSLPPCDYRICNIRFIYLSVSVARYLDRPNIMRVSKRTRSTRETFDFAVNLSETRELHPLCSSNRGGFKEGFKRHRFDQRKRTIRVSPSWDCFFGREITIVIRKIWFMGTVERRILKSYGEIISGCSEWRKLTR